jgi:hypothetical protein
MVYLLTLLLSDESESVRKSAVQQCCVLLSGVPSRETQLTDSVRMEI